MTETEEKPAEDSLAWFVVAGFYGIIVLLVVRGVPAGASEAVLVLVGQASMGFAAVMGFRYGTSMGSSRKTTAMLGLLRGGQSAGAERPEGGAEPPKTSPPDAV